MIAQQELIEPSVLRLFQHFIEQHKPVTQTVVRDQPKVSRNDPYPCGSGKNSRSVICIERKDSRLEPAGLIIS